MDLSFISEFVGGGALKLFTESGGVNHYIPSSSDIWSYRNSFEKKI